IYLDLMCCVLLSAGLIWAARHVRGTTEYADAFFPLVMLHLGHGEMFLWAGTVSYVLTTFCVVLFLLIQVVTRWRPGPLAALGSGICVTLLPLLYGGGVAYTPILAGSLLYMGCRLVQAQEPRQRVSGGICLVFALLGFLLVAAYVQGYKVLPLD